MKQIILVFSFLSFTLGNLHAQNIPVDKSVRIGTLENGMKYYIKQNQKPEKKVEFRLAINAGSVLEDEDQQGLAHFMEHMNFNGTKQFPDNKMVDELQAIGVKFGGHLNAYTSFDETVYMLPVPLDKPGNLDLGFKVMEDWAFNALLTNKEIDKERGVVLEELRVGMGPDKRMLDKYLPSLLYQSQYAKRLPIGDKKTLETFKPEVLKRFHKDWYRPNMMAIIVVGDINVEEIEKKIKSHFGKYKNLSTRERKEFVVPNHKQTLVSIESDPDATFSRIEYIIKDADKAKPYKTIAEYNNHILENLFITMLNNRLEELVNSNNPPFTYGFSYKGSLYVRTKQGLRTFAMVQEGKQLNGLKTLLEEIERARRFGFTNQELVRAKASFSSKLEKAYNDRDKTDSENFVTEYVSHYLSEEPIPGIEWEYNQFKSFSTTVTLQQANAKAKELIREDNRLVILTSPQKENIPQPTESQVLALFDQVKEANLKPYDEKTEIKNLVKPFKSKGKITKTEEDKKLGTTTFTLNNGAKVTYKKTDFKEDEIVFSAQSLGGSSLVSNQDHIKTQFAFPALTEAGFGGHSKSDITKFLSGKQASVNLHIGEITESMSGKSTVKDFETMMEMVYSYFTDINYDQASFNAYKEKQSAIYDNLNSNPQFYFSNELSKYIYKDNPRFTNIVPMGEDWAKTDYKRAYEIYKERFSNAGDFHFYFVGNVDEAKVKEYATKYLGNLPSTKKTETFKDLGYRSVSGIHDKVYKKGKDAKSMVIISYSGDANYSEKEKLAMNALGEIATVRIIEKLREEESGIYGGGARGGMSKTPYGNYDFSIQFPCGPENAKKLTSSALAEVENFISKGPEKKDLDKFVEGELNDHKTDLKNNEFWLRNLRNHQINGGDKYAVLNYENNIRSLTTKDVQEVSKKYLLKNRIIATLMPEDGWETSVVKEEKTTANIAPQKIVDAYITALGGKTKLESVKSIKMDTKMKVMGMEIEGKEIKLHPNKFKKIQNMMGQEMVQVFDGKKGYMMQGGNKMDMPKETIAELEKSKLFDALSLDPKDMKSVENVNLSGKDYYLVTTEKGKSYFDAKSGLLYKATSEQGDMTVVSYLTVDGIKIPGKMIIEAGGQNIEMENTNVIFNKDVKESDFK